MKHNLKKKGVIGFSKQKLSDGRRPVFVEKKKPLKDIADEDLVDSSKFDVIELGKVSAEVDRKKYDPVLGGCEIGISTGNFVGTLGTVLEVPSLAGKPLLGWKAALIPIIEKLGYETETAYFGLTNAHVAAVDVSSPVKGVSVRQPRSSTSIGSVLESIPIRSGSNRLDAALIAIDKREAVSLLQVSQELLTGFRKPLINEEVFKYGRTTNRTEGKLLYSGVTIKDIDYGGEKFTFTNCYLFSNMSTRGDSGSVIVAKDDYKGVALLFAGSPDYTIACDIEDALNSLGVAYNG